MSQAQGERSGAPAADIPTAAPLPARGATSGAVSGSRPGTAAATPPPLLSVRNLRVEIPSRRGTLTALHDLNFDVAAGEILGVVGESGAGKSLTGQAVIGLLEPPLRIAAGQVWFQGQDLAALDREALRHIRGRDIGAIFQDPLTSLNPLYTVGEMLVETLQTHLPLSRNQAEQRALDMLTEVSIPSARERLHHYPHQFSGGMRQRVVIALALCTNPKLVIADEPTTALDVSVQAQIITLLKRLCREHGTAVILVTHDMGVIAETAHRVCVMYAGRIVESGPVREVVQNPRHPYTLGLMSAIPQMRRESGPLAQIEGVMPRLNAIPPGCPFHPRCPRRFGPCDVEVPAAHAVGDQHTAACHLYGPSAGGALRQ
ncbi:MAG TPA: ABC transporter ATP-binding protein [bacterium]|nr:ABC transporter ATP-binding protein [bacterium]